MVLLFGVACIFWASVFTGAVLIFFGVGIIWINSITDRQRASDGKPAASRLKSEDILRGTAREILQMHWARYAQCVRKKESLMTCMWTESNDDSAWQLLSGWHEGQICTFYLCFTEDPVRLARFRAHRYYHLFSGDTGNPESEGVEVEFNVLDERAVEIFTAVLADIFDQKADGVKAYFG